MCKKQNLAGIEREFDALVCCALPIHLQGVNYVVITLFISDSAT